MTLFSSPPTHMRQPNSKGVHNVCIYLGHHITQSLDQRMQKTMNTWFKLKPFWTAANCTTRWKLRVYHAIIQNKLIYRLETLHLTQAMLKKIDAFHLCGLRSIGLETTFVRRNTNEFVLKINVVVFGPPPQETDDSDPLRQTTDEPSAACSYPIGKRRLGGPKQWRMNGVWNTSRQNQRIHQLALTRTFWMLSQCRPSDTWVSTAAKKNKGMFFLLSSSLFFLFLVVALVVQASKKRRFALKIWFQVLGAMIIHNCQLFWCEHYGTEVWHASEVISDLIVLLQCKNIVGINHLGRWHSALCSLSFYGVLPTT